MDVVAPFTRRFLTPEGVSNARFRESRVALNASCVHTRILLPTSHVKKDVIGESLTPPLAAMTFIDVIMHLHQAFVFIKMPGKKATWRGPYAEHNAHEQCRCLVLPAWVNLLPHDKKR